MWGDHLKTMQRPQWGYNKELEEGIERKLHPCWISSYCFELQVKNLQHPKGTKRKQQRYWMRSFEKDYGTYTFPFTHYAYENMQILNSKYKGEAGMTEHKAVSGRLQLRLAHPQVDIRRPIAWQHFMQASCKLQGWAKLQNLINNL